MLKSGILNPQINALLGRVRHTNRLVIADRGFPFFPDIETVDITLVDNLPTVLQVLAAIRLNFAPGQACMAREFLHHNNASIQSTFLAALAGIPLTHLPHAEFKQLVPRALGLIRTADTIPFANIILESA